MAENNLVRSRNDLPDFLSEDDPLAELARIVGYEERPVVNAAAPALRREPVFNLEDELLREFEQYDAPRLDPIHDIDLDDRLHASELSPSVSLSAPAPAVEPEELDFVPAEPVVAKLPPALDLSLDRQVDHFGDEEPPLAFDPVPQAFEPESAIEPVPEFSAPQEVHAEAPVESAVAVTAEPARFEPIFDLPDVPVTGPVSALPQMSQASAVPSVDEFDLASELENSILAPVAVVPQPEVKAQQPLPTAAVAASKAYVPGFRMPLANFNFGRATPQAQEARDAAVKFDMPGLADVPYPAQASMKADEPVADEATAADSASGPSLVPAQSAVEPSGKDRYSALDELIHDVQRYSLPISEKAPAAAAKVAEQAKVSEPMPVVAPEPVAPAVSEKAPVVTASSDEDKDPFADDEFELSLDDIKLDDLTLDELELELDLAEIVAADSEAASEAVVAPVAEKPAAPVTPVATALPITAASVVAATEVDASEDADAVVDLPFDPTQIAEAEEQVEAIADLDVPALPAEDTDQPPVYRPDYELDIDAELATLLVNSGKPEAAPAAVRKPDIDIASMVPAGGDRAAPAANASAYPDLDDFERALEEDFRRSLAAPLEPTEQEELHYADADYVATVETARRSVVRNWAVPVLVACALIAGGAGAYALIGNGVPGTSSGEPVIIVADTDPIKVAPEKPGGKTVPNQDKAVYDRVAGGAPQDPQQRSLISSNEKPIDVVQKTLMPDTIPLEGENDIDPTDVGETQDPRLLPNQGQVAANTAEQPVTVMPRRVKTMIVRPDGKLVEQEVASPVVAMPASAQVKQPASGVKPSEVASVLPAPAVPHTPAAAGIVPVSASANPAVPAERVNVVKSNPVTSVVSPPPASVAAAPQQAAPVVPQTPVAATPVQASATATTSRAPVPASRPAQQPVNVIAAVSDQGQVRSPSPAGGAFPTAPAAPTQVASLGADGGYVIQIASLPSQAEAQRSYQSLSSKFGTVIGGRGVDIKSAEIAGKGTFYRVRIPAGSKGDAVALCEKYRSAGGSCLVAR